MNIKATYYSGTTGAYNMMVSPLELWFKIEHKANNGTISYSPKYHYKIEWKNTMLFFLDATEHHINSKEWLRP